MYMLAKKIAIRSHRGQKDKCGIAYIKHPLAVAALVRGRTLKTIALLHDVVEDTDVTLEQLAKLFPANVVAAVDAISRREGERYFDYVCRCNRNRLAKVVKLADLAHNTSADRRFAGDEGLLKRSLKAVAILTE